MHITEGKQNLITDINNSRNQLESFEILFEYDETTRKLIINNHEYVCDIQDDLF